MVEVVARHGWLSGSPTYACWTGTRVAAFPMHARFQLSWVLHGYATPRSPVDPK